MCSCPLCLFIARIEIKQMIHLPTNYFIFSLLVLYYQHASSLQFSISRFDATSQDLIYEGDAKPVVGAIDFTSESYFGHVGRATYAEKLRLWDSRSRKVADFTTHFTIEIDVQGRAQGQYAAGLAFFLAHPDFPIPVNSIGGFLGLYNTTDSDSSQNQMVHVEFDTFPNPEWDPSYEHIGINKNSIASVVNTPWNVSFHSGDSVDVTITYNATTSNLTVSWSFEKTPNSNESTSLFYPIDLKTVLPERVMVGFSAATAYYMERHFLLSWDFNSSLVETESDKEIQNKIMLGLTIPIGSLIVILLVAVIIFWRRKWKHRGATLAEGTMLTSINNDLARGVGPRRFDYTDLVSATNNFSHDRKLGEGGFGAVYRGYIPELNIAVAVKKVSRGSKQGKKEYITEVRTISSLRHRNLVRLIGWCHEEGVFLLVYELMPNGSLNSHLFGRKPPLAWPVRYKISLGLASAIFYLHEEWEQCVIHRDIKSSNVMLDSNFNAKLGDFGLARLMDHELGPQTTGLAGTFGYLAPEYISMRRASKESDIYSFGVVALEIATGRKAIDPMNEESSKSLVVWVWEHYGSGKVLMAVDDRMGKDFDDEQVMCLMTVGLWCAHPDYSQRPSIKQVIQVLNFEAELPNIPNSMPVPLYHVPIPSVSSGEPLLSSIIEEGR